ncbi:MAG: hypothetical protein JNM30_11680 [Rhodospirillales bacterium]|nr:hypothetical protein [Rhodospirillales bacterium]
MTQFKTTLMRSAALSLFLATGLLSMPAWAEADNRGGWSACPNGSDFGNRGVCNEAPVQNLPQQPAPVVVQPQPQPAPSAGPSARGGGRNRGGDQGSYGRNNSPQNNDRGNGNGNRGYGGGYDRNYGRGGYSYDYRQSYPSYPGYPSYGYQQGYGTPAADPYYSGVMSEEQLAYVLQQQGFSRVETVDYATGLYTVDARDPNNRAVRLRVSGQNGQILEARAR